MFLLHGVGGGHAAWAASQAVLAAQAYRVVAWDMPGYGASAMAEPYTNAALTEALHALVAHIGAARNVLVGHSMGGMVAQEAIALRPSAIDGLVLLATSPAFGTPGGDWQQQFLHNRFAPLDAGLGMQHLAATLVGGMFAHSTDSTGSTGQLLATELMAQVPEATYRAALRAIVSFDQRANLAHIKVPTLCVAAEHDGNAPPAVMQKMAAAISQAHYTCLAGCGHLANMEQPAAFNAVLLAYLQQHFAH